MTELEVEIAKIGISIISSQAREIAYLHMRDFIIKRNTVDKNNSLDIKVSDIQTDN